MVSVMLPLQGVGCGALASTPASANHVLCDPPEEAATAEFLPLNAAVFPSLRIRGEAQVKGSEQHLAHSRHRPDLPRISSASLFAAPGPLHVRSPLLQ